MYLKSFLPFLRAVVFAALISPLNAQYVGVGKDGRFMSWIHSVTNMTTLEETEVSYYQSEGPFDGGPDMVPRRTIDTRENSSIFIRSSEKFAGSSSTLGGSVNPFVKVQFYNGFIGGENGVARRFIYNGIWGHRIKHKNLGTLVNYLGVPIDYTYASAPFPDQNRQNIYILLSENELDEPEVTCELLGQSGEVVHRFDINLATCDSCTSNMCSPKAGIGSVDYEIPIGMSVPIDGKRGRNVSLRLYQEDITLTGRESVSLEAPILDSSVIPSYDANNKIESVRVGDKIARILDVGGGSEPYGIRVEISSDYENPQASIVRAVTFINKLDGNDMPYLECDDYHDNKHYVSNYYKMVSGDWVLETGNGLRRETRSIDRDSVPGQRLTRVKIEELISEATENVPAVYAVVSDILTRSENTASGYRDVEKIVDPSGVALKTSISYYGVNEDSSIDSSNSSEGYGKVKQIIHPSGEIENHYYFTFPQNEFFDSSHLVRRAYAGTQQAREIATDSFSGVSPVSGLAISVTRIVERVGGHTIAKREISREARAEGYFIEERTYSDSANFTSKYTIVDNSGNTTVVNPDGTAVITSQSSDPQTGYTTSTSISGFVNGSPLSLNLQIQPKTISEKVTGVFGEEVISTEEEILNGETVPISWQITSDFDSSHRATRIEHYFGGSGEASYVTEREFGCCGLMRDRDENGIDTLYGYDDLQRVVISNRGGVTTATVRKGLTISVHRYSQIVAPGTGLLFGGGNPSNEVSRIVTNLAGDTVEKWNRSFQDGGMVKTGIETSYNVGGGVGRRVVTSPPIVADDDSSIPIQIEEFYLDGRPFSVLGNISINKGFRYLANSVGSQVESYYLDGTVEKEAVVAQSDWAGRQISMSFASDLDGVGGNDISSFSYNPRGQLEKSVDPDGVVTLFGYGDMGDRRYTVVDINRNGSIDFSVDRVSCSEIELIQRQGGEWVRRVVNREWLGLGSGSSSVASYSDTSLDGRSTWVIEAPSVQSGDITISKTVLAGVITEVMTRTDGTSETKISNVGLLTNIIERDSAGSVLFEISFTYDAQGRPVTRSDSRTGIVTQYYLNDATDVVTRVTDFLGRETALTYDHRGRKKSEDLPDSIEGGNVSNNLAVTSHYPDGTVKEENGGGNYRALWTYDYARRRQTMTTFGLATAVTRWIYDQNRGFLIEKRYGSPNPNSGKGVSYAYTAAGRLKSRTQAREVNGTPILSTYSYGTATGSCMGDLDGVEHSDGTPGYTVAERDRLGRIIKIIDPVGGTRDFVYTLHGDLKSEEVTTGILAGQKNEQNFDSLLRVRSQTAIFGSQELGTTFYRYGASGAVAEVEGHGYRANYHYHPQKGVLDQIAYSRSGDSAPWLESKRTFDAANRLSSTTTHVSRSGGWSAVDHHAYNYDELDRVVSHRDVKGDSWSYQYNNTGELSAATKLLKGGVSKVSGSDYRYYYDGIGNRTLVSQSRKEGESPRTYEYVPTSLNGYSLLTHPSFADITGSASAAATVTINGVVSSRQGEYFRGEISEDNSNASRWINASVSDGSNTVDGSMALRASSVAPSYDDDGNLLTDGVWNYSWDAENRLIRVERVASLVADGAPYLRLEYDYDFQGRRIRASTYTSGGGGPSAQIVYVFQGWRCLAELSGAGQILRKYTWGLDIEGDIGDSKTGNIGALLWLVDGSTNSKHIYVYDRNGNVSGLVNGVTSMKSASYEYDSFGQLTMIYGDYARENPFTFSTKNTDFVTGLLYYGYRWYSPSHGRWLSRDPIGEDGGRNLYGFVSNNSINFTDRLGLEYGFSPGEFPGPYPDVHARTVKLLGKFLFGASETNDKFSSEDAETKMIRNGYLGDSIRKKVLAEITPNPLEAKSKLPISLNLGGEANDIPAYEYLPKAVLWWSVVNPISAFTGSFSGGTVTITSIDCKSRKASFTVHAVNRSGAESGTRFPGFMGGYDNYGALARDGWFPGLPASSILPNTPPGLTDYPLNTISQTYDWTEEIAF